MKTEFLAKSLPVARMAVLDPEDKTRHEITASLRAHQQLIYQFAKAWYDSPYTFQSTRVFGHTACKIPFDLWVMHDLFCQYRFETVIECGTASGGTTLWYAFLMDMLKIEGGRIFSIDNTEVEGRPEHPRITYIHGSSTDPEIYRQVSMYVNTPIHLSTCASVYHGNTALLGPCSCGALELKSILVNLDSNHLALHVLEELELWAPLVPIGSWLVIEDTNGSPIMTDPDTGQKVSVEGPLAAVMEYLARHPGEFFRDVVCERYWLTMNPHGWLQRVAEHNGQR